jgi:hypothetical protein
MSGFQRQAQGAWRGVQSRLSGFPPAARIAIIGGSAFIALCLVCAMCGGIISALGGGGKTTTAQQQNTAAPSGPTATPKPPTETPKPKTYQTVQHLTGSGNKTTQTFHIQNGDQIVWKTDGKSSANLFIADLYRNGDTYGNDAPYMSVANVANQKSGGDTSTVQAGDADVYLWVEALSVNWTVDIQRLQ